MIREKTILCKLNQIKKLDIQLIKSAPTSRKICPNCGALDCCIPHASYKRFLISIIDGARADHEISIQRVLCTSCKKTHALLSDALIPFASYSLRFVLHVLKAYITRTGSVETLCDTFQIAISTLYKWIQLFTAHTNLILSATQQISAPALPSFALIENRNALPLWFWKRYRFSYLQNHKQRSTATVAVSRFS